MDIESLKEALETGHKSSTVLREVLNELVNSHHCPAAYGFEGIDTFSDCEECAYCRAKQLRDDGVI